MRFVTGHIKCISAYTSFFPLNAENVTGYICKLVCSISLPSLLLWVNIWWGRTDSSWNRWRLFHLATLCESSTPITPHFPPRKSELRFSLSVAVAVQLWVCRMHAASLQRKNKKKCNMKCRLEPDADLSSNSLAYTHQLSSPYSPDSAQVNPWMLSDKGGISV